MEKANRVHYRMSGGDQLPALSVQRQEAILNKALR